VSPVRVYATDLCSRHNRQHHHPKQISIDVDALNDPEPRRRQLRVDPGNVVAVARLGRRAERIRDDIQHGGENATDEQGLHCHRFNASMRGRRTWHRYQGAALIRVKTNPATLNVC
jgi:hypothetical protein